MKSNVLKFLFDRREERIEYDKLEERYGVGSGESGLTRLFRKE